MKVAHLTAWYPPHTMGGTEIYVEGLAIALRQMGHDVAIAGPLAGITTPERSVRASIPVMRYPIPSEITKDEARGTVPARGTEHLLSWIRQWQPDIVHVHSLSTGLHVAELSEIAASGARIIVTLHLPTLTYICQRGTLAIWGHTACDGVRLRRRCAACALESRGLVRPAAWAVASTPIAIARAARGWPGPIATALAMPAYIDDLAAQQRELFSIVDAAVALNTPSVEILAKNHAPADKVVLNALGISHAAERKPSPDAAPTTRPVTVGFLGRLSRHKGVEELLRAINRLPADLPMKFLFHGIAAGTEGERLSAEIAALAASRPGVQVKAELAPHEVPRVLSSIDVLCAPSRWFENGPTIALEAVAAGTPVIGTRIGAFRDFVTDGVNGRLVEPNDEMALARALEEIGRDPEGTIDRWRRHLPSVRTMKEISADYDRLYRRIVPAHASQVAG